MWVTDKKTSKGKTTRGDFYNQFAISWRLIMLNLILLIHTALPAFPPSEMIFYNTPIFCQENSMKIP